MSRVFFIELLPVSLKAGELDTPKTLFNQALSANVPLSLIGLTVSLASECKIADIRAWLGDTDSDPTFISCASIALKVSGHVLGAGPVSLWPWRAAGAGVKTLSSDYPNPTYCRIVQPGQVVAVEYAPPEAFRPTADFKAQFDMHLEETEEGWR